MTEEKIYALETVMSHIHMIAQMVHLADWRGIILRPETRAIFEEAVRKAEDEFLEEFKDKDFYTYVKKLKEALKLADRFSSSFPA